MLPQKPSTTTPAVDTTKGRHHGYDNCKMVFMFLVILWHTANLGIMEVVLYNGTRSDGTEATVNSWEGPFSKREHFYHPHWNPFLIHLVHCYWRWTEKVAVPGFAFLSGYFGKGYLGQKSYDHSMTLQDVERDQQKERVRWETSILCLIVTPILWQFSQIALTFMCSGLYGGNWKGHWTLMADPEKRIPAQLPLWDFLETWYLFALLLWRMMTALILSRLRQTHLFPFWVSLILAFLSVHTNRGRDGGFPGEGAGFEMQQRLFFFFPFYVAGLYWEETTWLKLTTIFCRFTRCGENPDRASRYLGGLGMLLTLTICQLVPFMSSDSWHYKINSYHWKPHFELLCEYMVSVTAFISVILVLKTIRVPLFPFQHAGSTLAIYVSHWPFADFLAWGDFRYIVTPRVMNTSVIQYMFTRLGPLPVVLGSHLICYLLCILLGNKWIWDKALRHLCDPQWAGRLLFPATGDHDEASVLPLTRRPSASSYLARLSIETQFQRCVSNLPSSF